MVKEDTPSQGHADSEGSVSAPAQTTKTRRSHRKSRWGCAECKRRHIRCDERRPLCGNCQVAERTCFFPSSKGRRQDQTQQQQDNASERQQSNDISEPGHAFEQMSLRSLLESAVLPPTSNTYSTSSTLSADYLRHSHSPASDSLSTNLNTPAATSYTPQHMILLHHAPAVPGFSGPNRNVVDIAVRRAIDSPYFLDEVLAYTAAHIAWKHPSSAAQLRNIATELQTRAIASFTRLTETVPNDDKPTSSPRFLFSAILGRHVLNDTLSHYTTDFHTFIDRFVECCNINRGIRAVTPLAREFFHDSEVKAFLNVILDAEKRVVSPGNECDSLMRLIDASSDLSQSSADACRKTISHLQWCFDLCGGLAEENYPEAVSAFSVRLETDFVELLCKQRPEALLVLAYLGVLLHRCRKFWGFGDPGGQVVRVIAGHLGTYWQEALMWPLHVIETEGGST